MYCLFKLNLCGWRIARNGLVMSRLRYSVLFSSFLFETRCIGLYFIFYRVFTPDIFGGRLELIDLGWLCLKDWPVLL